MRNSDMRLIEQAKKYKIGKECDGFFYSISFYADKERFNDIDKNNNLVYYNGINMTEETPQQAARYTSFGHDFQKLVAASSGVSNPVFEMKLNLPDSFDSEIKKIIKANFPRKCNKCGFSKFFTIKITSLSMGDSFIAECPKCEEEVKDFSEYEDKKVGK